jgi:hypothetical protein
MRTRVLRRPIVFIRVRCIIFVRCSILVLLMKTVRCSTHMCVCVCVCVCVYGKAIPLQSWTGPEDSRSLRLPDLKQLRQ